MSSGSYGRGRGDALFRGRGNPGSGPARGRGEVNPRGASNQAWRGGGGEFRGARGGRGDFRGTGRGGYGDESFRGGRGGGTGPATYKPTANGGHGDAFRGRGTGFGGPAIYRPTANGGHGGESFRGGRGRGTGFGSPAIYKPVANIQVDSRLQDESQKKLLDSLKLLSAQEKELQKAGKSFPLRPDFGTEGRDIKLRSNYFPVILPDVSIFEYDVSISSLKSKKILARVKRRVFQLAERSPEWVQFGLKGNVAHDRVAKVLSAKELPNPTTIEVDYYEEDEEGPAANAEQYTITITKTRDLHLQDIVNFTAGERQYKDFDIAPLLSALNIIMASHATGTGGEGIMVGRNKFFFPNTSIVWELGGGLQAFRGFYSSVRPTHYQLMINVNVCTTAFYKPGNLADAINEFMRASFNANPKDFVKKGLKISLIHLRGRYKTVNTISNHSAKQYTFNTPEDPNKISVETYFKKKYGITLKYPDLPLVDVGGKIKTLLPPEVCVILPNQAFLGKLMSDHTRKMIEFAAQPPNVNATAIVDEGLKLLGFTGSSSPRDSFGVKIKPEMTVVPGRILQPPKIEYGKSAPQFDNEKASWNLRGVKFALGAPKLENWVVISIYDGNNKQEPRQDDPALKVMTAFIQTCQNSGIQQVAKPQYLKVILPPFGRDDPLRENAVKTIMLTTRQLKQKPRLALILLSNDDKHIYNGIKRVFDTVLDVASVCSISSMFAKGQVQYFANVALKINAKLGGVNHKLDRNGMAWFQQAPTMIVGIDVTHPTGKVPVKGTPSIAAVVASCDAHFAQYPASMELQKGREEMVQALDKMMIERLKLYQQKNGNKLPERILIYRDGVSEGQYWLVMEKEFPKLQSAFRSFDKPQKQYEPKLTIVICAKRHHTRFYPTADADADRSKKNPLPGTVVDRGVTSIYHFDFFLQAHAGLQGSTKPTHYFVVHDTIGFNANQLQRLTNDISYMFARATKAVSLASPAYYADLACERGRCYINRLLQGYTSSTGTTSSAGSNNDEEVEKEAAALWNGGVNGPQLRNTMYYL